MELSLFSRDVIALAPRVALSAHNMFDARSTSASATRSCRAW
jgi:dihydroxyacid dehydratase/phosphogluconate dehydratase